MGYIEGLLLLLLCCINKGFPVQICSTVRNRHVKTTFTLHLSIPRKTSDALGPSTPRFRPPCGRDVSPTRPVCAHTAAQPREPAAGRA